MKLMARLLAAVLVLLPFSVAAQQYPTVPDHTVMGRIGTGSGSGPSQAIPWSLLYPQLFGTQSANTIFAGPSSGSAASPLFRAMVPADLPAATNSARGGVQCDGTTTNCSSGVISATNALAASIDASGSTSVQNGANNGCLYETPSGKIGIRVCPIIPQAYGAGASAEVTTGSIGSGSTSLTLTNAEDFKNGEYIRINAAGAAFAIGQVTSGSATFTGTAGSTTYQYTVATMDSAGGVGATVSAISCSSANATLSTSNYCTVSWTAPTGTAPRAYIVFKYNGSSYLFYAITPSTSFKDYGQGANTAPDWVPVAAGGGHADWLISQISSGGGTTTLTLATSSTTAASSVVAAHDDTTPMQSALTQCFAVGGELYIPPGTYPISSTVSYLSGGTGHCKISGAGYESNAGLMYQGSGPPSSAIGVPGSVIVPLPTVQYALQIRTVYAIQLYDFEILYPTGNGTPVSDTYAILGTSPIGSTTDANDDSVIQNVAVAGAANVVQLDDWYDFKIDGLRYSWAYYSGITINSSNYPSFGDSTITNSKLWSWQNSLTFTCHICVYSGGGLRIVNNKLNWGGVNGAGLGQGILIDPNLAVTQNIEPLIITGNSIEGMDVGIYFQQANSSGTANLAIIADNEIWAAEHAIFQNQVGTGQWLLGTTIDGNTLQINGTGFSPTGNNVITLANASFGVITGNTFTCAGGCSSSNGYGVNLGQYTTGVNVQSNTYASGFTSPGYNNSGTGNTIGGGSK